MNRHLIRSLGIAAVLGVGLSLPARGDTFKCVDANGHVIYTNMKEETRGRNCTVVMREISVVPSNPRGPASAESASPAGFPKVDAATQRSRDDERRKILQDELSAEQKALTKAKEDLAQQESVRNGNERNYQKVLDRLQPYKDDVERHEKNIEALNKELSNVK
jgi:septal ring factor EnvC (AmiA/AmiB activator)